MEPQDQVRQISADRTRVRRGVTSNTQVGCLGERAMLPFVVKPRSPLPEHMREEMKREKEVDEG